MTTILDVVFEYSPETEVALMSAADVLPRLAIVQQPMRWTTDENVQTVLSALAAAAAAGAGLVVYPELSLTGFHRRIREQGVASIVAPAMQRVREACRRHRVAAAIGLPTFGATGLVFNSHAYVDADGPSPPPSPRTG